MKKLSLDTSNKDLMDFTFDDIIDSNIVPFPVRI